MFTYVLLLLSSVLVAALPQGGSAVDIDPKNPSGADPTKPPSKISVPPRPRTNPFAGGIPKLPSDCTDPAHPSDACFNALQVQAEGVQAEGGYLVHDGSCDEAKVSQLETAAWDASTLANYARTWPDGARGIAAGHFYIGPDFKTQEQRIKDNLGRAADFKLRGKNYMTVSCKDTKNYCNVRKDGKTVGGYAWTYKGWFGYYYYVTLCPAFFSLDSLDQKFEEIEKKLADGFTKEASDARYLRSTGQFFLHEMMHLDLIGDPHINDERVQEDNMGPWAYGPFYVHKLAQRSLNNGGGATRASTNADSYAVLANTLYWWDTTGYFPGVPGKNNPSLSAADAEADQSPISLYLGDVSGVKGTDFTDLFNKTLDGFSNDKAPSNPPAAPVNGPGLTKTPCKFLEECEGVCQPDASYLCDSIEKVCMCGPFQQ